MTITFQEKTLSRRIEHVVIHLCRRFFVIAGIDVEQRLSCRRRRFVFRRLRRLRIFGQRSMFETTACSSTFVRWDIGDTGDARGDHCVTRFQIDIRMNVHQTDLPLTVANANITERGACRSARELNRAKDRSSRLSFLIGSTDLIAGSTVRKRENMLKAQRSSSTFDLD